MASLLMLYLIMLLTISDYIASNVKNRNE